MKTFTLTSSLLFSVVATGCMIGDGSNETDEDVIGGSIDNGDPSVVAVFAHAAGATSGSLCTGSVISSTTVLTAAHCVDPTAVGANQVYDVWTGPVFGQGTRLSVASVAWDTAFDINNPVAGHDIAIVKLAQPTTLAPLPFGQSTGSGSVRIVGFGMNTHVVNPYIPSGAGQKRQARTNIDSATATQITIGNTGVQTCHGDSGGPAFQTINGRETIVGVVSYGEDLSSTLVCVQGGTDTRVGAYMAFINAHL